MESVYRETLPACDICKATDLPVVYDMPYRGGQWANLCEQCRQGADNPAPACGSKIVRGTHPDADPVGPKTGMFTMGAVLESKRRRDKELTHARRLSSRKLKSMASASVVTTADGCRVEPDGQCEHGYRSPLRVLGIM